MVESRPPPRSANLLSAGKSGFGGIDLGAFFPDVEPDPAKQPHIDIRYKNQGETGDYISAPIVKQKPIARHDENCNRYIVTEAVLACKHIKEFPLISVTAHPAFFEAEVVAFPKEFLVCDGPRDAGNGKGEDKQLQQVVHN